MKSDASGRNGTVGFDPTSGAMIQRIEDVDTAQAGDAPGGWTTPTGGGLHLVTDFLHDSVGRITRQLGPVHSAEIDGAAKDVRRAQWHVYLDIEHEQWLGHGYYDIAADAYFLINPVAITIRDASGMVHEDIEAVRDTAAGELTAADSFPQSSYSRWTTRQFADCCRLASQRVYHTIPASGAGQPGTNYDETEFGYDSMNRRNRTVTPGGTIHEDEFDVRGLTVAQRVGTTASGGQDMVLLWQQQFDGGLDGGDGNLTRRTEHVDDTGSRVTDFAYDWRHRQVEIDGELDHFEQRQYDNLDRVVRVERRDTSAAGQLLSREETLFDKRGHVYRLIRYGVDPNSGSITGQQDQDQTFDPAGNLLKQQPAGAIEYLEFQYDSLGRRTKVTDPLDHSRQYAFDPAGNMVAETDPEEEVWTRGFDNQPRPATAGIEQFPHLGRPVPPSGTVASHLLFVLQTPTGR